MHLTCPVCHGDEETILHVLVTCPFAACCWNKLVPEVQQHPGGIFAVWLSHVFNQIDKDRRAEVATLCWALWRARNERVWDNK